jgi:hypothetical protein
LPLVWYINMPIALIVGLAGGALWDACIKLLEAATLTL